MAHAVAAALSVASPRRARRALTLAEQRVGRELVELVVQPAHTGRFRECPQGLLVVGVNSSVGPVERHALEEVTGGRKPGLEREALAPVVRVDDDANLDSVRVDAASLADWRHLDEGDRLTVEQHKPGTQPVLAPAREPARELVRHSLARQRFARACRRHGGGRVADREQRVEVALVDGAKQKPSSAKLERHATILGALLTSSSAPERTSQRVDVVSSGCKPGRDDQAVRRLCAVKDVFSNRIVGYSIDSRMKSSLAVAALANAVAQRTPDATIVLRQGQPVPRGADRANTSGSRTTRFVCRHLMMRSARDVGRLASAAR